MRLLIEKKISSVFVRAAAGETGIVTERDLMRALDGAASGRCRHPSRDHEGAAADGAGGRFPLSRHRPHGATGLPPSRRRDAAGELVGAVTTRNLLRHRATTAIVLGDEIDSAGTDAALGRAWAKLPLMARSLMAERSTRARSPP